MSQYRYFGFIALVLFLTGCTHLEYTYMSESGGGPRLPDEFGATSVEFSPHGMHEITWLDPTGVVCAGATTGLDAINEAKKGQEKAEREGKSSYTIEYNVYAPVSGLYCGSYYRWGTGEVTLRDVPPTVASEQTEDLSTVSRLREFGFHVEGREQFEDFDWLVWNFGLLLGGGGYTWTEDEAGQRGQIKDYDDPFFFRLPLFGGIGIYPRFLYGLGLQLEAGADLPAWALSSGAGSWYEKFDYDVSARYQLVVDSFIIAASGGFRRTNLSWGEYWVARDGPYGNLAVSLVF